jgi:low temperature requirement protein LtrA
VGLFGASALFGGTALYIAGHAFFWRRMSGRWNVLQFAAATLLIALIPVALVLPALVCLALVAAVVIATAATQGRAEP